MPVPRVAREIPVNRGDVQPTPGPNRPSKIDSLQQRAMIALLPVDQEFPAQEWPFEPGPRTVKVHVRTPSADFTPNTGLMLVLHNWGGRYDEPQYLRWCGLFADRYNVVALSVNYLQSGEHSVTPGKPYDCGYLQAMDVLGALAHVTRQLDAMGVVFNRRRCYAMGVSGGGNVTLMANKFAPHTFACAIDICGMPGLVDGVAYGEDQPSGLDAGYSRDPAHPCYLSADMQEIRDPGHPAHLEQQFAASPHNKVVIVHGLDDDVCLTPVKIDIFRKMVIAGFRPDGHFLTQWHIDGEAVLNTGHSIGNRDLVLCRFADSYLLEESPLALQVTGPNDFERGSVVQYATTNGRFTVDYSATAPAIKFNPATHPDSNDAPSGAP